MYQNVALYFDVIHLKMFHKLENVKVMPIVILNFTVVNVFLGCYIWGMGKGSSFNGNFQPLTLFLYFVDIIIIILQSHHRQISIIDLRSF